MQISPLQLEDYFLKELHFSVVDAMAQPPEKDAQYAPVQFNVNVDSSQQGEDPRLWRCELAIQSREEENQNLPYRFRISFVGFFRVSKEWPEERVELVARANGPALLYSSAREMLVTLTGRGSFPTLVLPSVTFIPAAAAGKDEPKAEPTGGGANPPGAKPARSKKGAPRKSTKAKEKG